jgi:hypothetical protein
MTRLVIHLFLLLLNTSFTLAQNAPISDPQALSLVAQSIAAMTGGAVITDVTITGNATWIAGSDRQTGPATLMAKGGAESRVDLNLSGGSRSEIRNDTAGYPQGASVSVGTLTPSELHNCWVNASWFFPALSFLNAAADPTLIFSYVGQESPGGVSIQHLRVFRYLADQRPAEVALIQRLSTMDIYLDSASLLPIAFLFNVHPDDDAMTDIARAILFSNYQTVNGVQAPFRVQRFVQNGMAVDVVLTGMALNSGLPDTLFAVQ